MKINKQRTAINSEHISQTSVLPRYLYISESSFMKNKTVLEILFVFDHSLSLQVVQPEANYFLARSEYC